MSSKLNKKQPKTLTEKTLQQLQNAQRNINEARRELSMLSVNDEMTIGHVMFCVGSVCEKINRCYDELDKIIDSLDDTEYIY